MVVTASWTAWPPDRLSPLHRGSSGVRRGRAGCIWFGLGGEGVLVRPVGVDVLVIGAGVLGRSIAFALASAEPGLRVALAGRRGAGASEAAGAMLGVLGEVTESGLHSRHGELRVRMAVEAAVRWPTWRALVHQHGERRAGGGPRARDGYGTGTFMLLNAVSARLDERAFTAVREAGRRYGLPVEDVDPDDVPAYRPLENDRALRALYLPQEAFLDARRWLAALDRALGALGNVVRTPAGELGATAAGYALHSRDSVFTAPTAVVAAGAWSTPLLHALDPDLTVCPVVAAEGTSVTLGAPTPLPAVLRTPNRAYACGLHAVPQADGSWYVGASAAPSLVPGAAPTAGALRFLLDAALGQLHHGLTATAVHRLHHGNRPIGVDGHPLLGATSAPGLWVATGTHRDGLHASPLIAQELAAEILGGRPSAWLAPWRPERDLICDWPLAQAVEEAAAHYEALTAESRMRPPLTGDWPTALAELYRQRMQQTYAQLPEGFVLPPELAPLGYDHSPELAKLVAAHLDRRRRAAAPATPRAREAIRRAGEGQE
ncbi:NAD(P)/FAD-dependent oxidoreductase [Kitasatospora purpeofusca]|uniref:NAD(P)/FAD-dependent oxidoreductase n=1 Tax=Kitasatospora purpeofusca TaxID=67352 RepID=UPI00386E836A